MQLQCWPLTLFRHKHKHTGDGGWKVFVRKQHNAIATSEGGLPRKPPSSWRLHPREAVRACNVVHVLPPFLLSSSNLTHTLRHTIITRFMSHTHTIRKWCVMFKPKVMVRFLFLLYFRFIQYRLYRQFWIKIQFYKKKVHDKRFPSTPLSVLLPEY